MSAEYKIIVYNNTGVKTAEITEYRSLRYTKKRHEPGECSFSIDGRSAKRSLLPINALVEVWRKNNSVDLDWYCDFYGIVKAIEHVKEETETFTVYAPGILSILADRIIAFRENVSNRSVFSSLPAETVIKTLVQYNSTSSATTGNSRIRDGTALPITIAVETDSARGATVSYLECHEENLLQVLQDVAMQYDCTFDMYRKVTDRNAANNTFTLYFGYIDSFNHNGIDFLSYDKVYFSMNRGNLKSARYLDDRRSEKTVAVVGGKKAEGQNKDYSTVVSHRKTAVAADDREIYVAASNTDNSTKRSSEGSSELMESLAEPQYEFKPLQTPGTYYGKHYDINCYVTAQFDTVEHRFVVSEVTITVDDQKREDVDVTLLSSLYQV